MAIPHWVPAEDRYEKARPKAAQPSETFYTSGTLKAGPEQIDYGYLINAHTSGDIYVFFRDSNVLAAGDVAAPVHDPELDYFTGAWIGGRVDAMDRLLKLSDDKTRIIPGYVTNLGVTIALDDFTENNGATFFLPKSHTMKEPPTEEYFYKHAKRFIAKAGSVWFFNARIWHAGGDNKTSQWRHGLTLNMCRPYMKQRIDIPRAMANMDLSSVSEKALQKLGFLAQTPANYDEYYVTPEKRKYRQKYE